MIPLAQNIKNRMKMLGIDKDAEAARLCGIEPRTFHNYVTNFRSPRPEFLEKIATGLKTTVLELLAGKYEDEEHYNARDKGPKTLPEEKQQDAALREKMSLRLS